MIFSKIFNFLNLDSLMFGFSLYGKQGSVSEYMAGTQILGEGRLKTGFDDVIHTLNIEKSILLFMLSKIGKKPVGRMKYSWLNKERKADWVTLTSIGGAWLAGAAATGTLQVGTDDIYLFAEGDIIQIPSVDSAKNIYIDSVNQTTRMLTCYTVGSGNIDLSGVGSNWPDLFLIGNSFELGSGKGTIKSQQPDENYNYLQIIQTPVGVTTTDMHQEYLGVDEFTEQKREAAIDHAFKLEKTLFFGERKILTTGYMDGTYAQYFTGGLKYYLSSNVTNASGALTRSEFDTWVDSFTKYAKDPVIFSSELIFKGLSTWSEEKLQVARSEKILGMAVAQYLTNFGQLVPVIPHRELLTNDYAGCAFGVDMADVEYRFLQGLDTHLEVGIQLPDVKQQIDEFRTWMGFWIGNQKRHGYLYGATSISTS